MSRSRNKIAIFGGSFNPPGNHHLYLAKKLTGIFDKTIITLSGIRPHKSSLTEITPEHRKNMVKLAFQKMKNIEFDFDDIDDHTFTPTWRLQEKYQQLFPDAEIWFAVGSDLVKNGKHSQSEIQQLWQHGTEIWKKLNFAIFVSSTYKMNKSDHPPNAMFIKTPLITGRSTIIRKKVANDESIDDLVPAEVIEYIKTQNLYR